MPHSAPGSKEKRIARNVREFCYPGSGTGFTLDSYATSERALAVATKGGVPIRILSPLLVRQFAQPAEPNRTEPNRTEPNLTST